MQLVKNHNARVDILLVDDQQRNLDALASVLADPLYNLVQASSGAEALRLLSHHDFAVVLLDVMMPEMDGFACALKIREFHRTPIIFVTAVADDMGFIFRGYRSGAVDFITKPFEPSVVKSKVAIFAELALAKQLLKTQLEDTRVLCSRLEEEVARGRRDRQDVAEQVRALLANLESSVAPTTRLRSL